MVKRKKKCKGVKKYVVKKHISFKDYEEAVLSGKTQHRVMNTIRSRKHDIGSEKINKIAQSNSGSYFVIYGWGPEINSHH